MSQFFTKFPKIRYNIENTELSPHTTITNVFFRINLLKDVLTNASAYYYYIVKDKETPEDLAFKFYKNVEYHWVILYANEILDPLHEWPKDYNTFNKFIVSKYGSIENAKTTDHHYEMVITRENIIEQTKDITRFEITKEKLTDNSLTVPFDYYEGTGSLEDTQGVQTFVVNSKDVIETVERATISNYDYEYELNESRRKIKVIKKDYIGQINTEFRKLTGPYTNRILRTLREGG